MARSAFRKFFNKTSGLIVLGLFLASIYFCWGWYTTQYDKAVGMYYVYQGDKAYQKFQLQKAIDFYNKGLEYYPEHYSAQYNLGNIYVAYEDYYSAADAYQKAIQYNKNYTLARMNLGIISAEKLGDFDGAIEQYNKIIGSRHFILTIPFVFNNKNSEYKNRGLAYYNMGVAYREKSIYRGNHYKDANMYLQKAIDSYTSAEKILKEDYDLTYNLAVAYQLSGDYQDAGKTYCKAIQIRPMAYESHYNLAILLRHLKMYKEAYKEIEKAAVLISNSNDVSSNVSSYLFSVLNDLSKSIIDTNGYKYLIEKMDDEPSSGQVTYVGGRIVATDALDRAMLKNFSTCENDRFSN